MTTAMTKLLINEIAAIEDWLQFDDGEELTEFNTLDEARIQIEGMQADFDEFPETLSDPEVMMMCWNYVVSQKKALLEKKRIQKQDDEIAAMNPDCLRFRKAYDDGSSAFFDPDQLSHDLQRTGYDAVHRMIIAKALVAYKAEFNN